MSETVQFALVVCSDRAAAGERQDGSAAGLRELVEKAGHRWGEVVCVADRQSDIENAIRDLSQRAAVVLTTGGTGLSSRDVTVEATQAVVDREIPGFGEAMRAASLKVTPMAMLSRATAGTLGKSLIINLPGSPKGAVECLEVVLPVIRHASRVLAGGVKDCQQDLSR